MSGVAGDRARVRYTGRYDNISFNIKTTFPGSLVKCYLGLISSLVSICYSSMAKSANSAVKEMSSSGIISQIMIFK